LLRQNFSIFFSPKLLGFKGLNSFAAAKTQDEIAAVCERSKQVKREFENNFRNS